MVMWWYSGKYQERLQLKLLKPCVKPLSQSVYFCEKKIYCIAKHPVAAESCLITENNQLFLTTNQEHSSRLPTVHNVFD